MRRALIGRTDGDRVLTLVIEQTIEPTSWLIITVDHPGFHGDRAALDEVERLFWSDIWNTAVPDAVEEQGIALARFGPIQAMVVAGLPDAPVLNLVLGAAEPGTVDEGHLTAASGVAMSRSTRTSTSSPARRC